ncbi:MAG: NAD(P)-dependent oxidoreductase [Verrucomicrobiota bacterium]
MKVSLLGLGIIGTAWAPHYRAAGYELKVWNRTPQQVEGYEEDIAACVEGADVVQIVVSDPPAVENVIDAIESKLGPDMLVIQSSTISSPWARKFCDRVQAKGAGYVEAPFTGSKVAAEQAQTVFFLGGDEAHLPQAQNVLGAVSQKCFQVGTVEQACGLKLSMNLQIALISQALNEGLTLARQFKLSDEKFFEVLGLNVAHSGLADLKQSKLMARDYAPQFSVKHMHKDLCLALDSADPGILPLTKSNAELYQRGMDQGWADDDFTALIELLKKVS